MTMNILIIGAGGREHALAWKAAQSSKVDQVFVAPGNAGTAVDPNIKNVAINIDDQTALIEFAKNNDVGLTIVGPEQPLVQGLVDAFEQADLAVFGPNQQAAQLEGSKAFSKDFLKRHKIPTAAYETFTDEQQALDYLRSQTLPIVIKADGLAAGKGVIIAETFTQAEQAIKDMLSGNRFGAAGARVVIESFLQGEELSYIVMVDGTDVLPMASSQDHKARDEGDKGPNTGGMGAYSPAPLLTAALEQRVLETVIKPTVEGLKAEGIYYRGFLYAGLMISSDGTPNVLEYNCRFGDPETQPIMLRLESDLVELCLAAIEGTLHQHKATWKSQAAVGVVMAAGGYPFEYNKGDIIQGLDSIMPIEAIVFHAGTAEKNGHIITQGGRVLCVTSLGKDVKEAQDKAYAAVAKITWDNAYYRKDIGFKALKQS
jgi:phosphoribosylamine--glycine ligase